MATDLVTFAIPFFFLLAIVYGALEVGSPFKNKGVKAIISLAVAAFGILNEYVVTTINQIMPYAAVFFVAVFFLKFLHSFFEEKTPKNWTLIMIVLGLVLLLTMRFADYFRAIPGLPVSFDNILASIGIVILIGFFYAAYKKGG